MKICAAVFADFHETYFGGPAQLATRLGKRTILEHTLRRLVRVAGISQRVLVVPARDEATARAALESAGLRSEVACLAVPSIWSARRELLRAGRLWNIHAWRGSPLGSTWFDEFVDGALVAHVLAEVEADAALCLAGHQPVFDPDLASQMVAQQHARQFEAPFTFCQAPPGIAGVIVSRLLAQELIQEQLPLGISLTYRPEMPQSDPLNRPPCFQVDTLLSQTAGRLTGDTRRSREIIAAALEDLGEDADGVALVRWLRQSPSMLAGPLPLEVEFELTVDDPLPETTLRPRGARVPQRAPADVTRIAELMRELGAYDDRHVVFGGFGDPLRHPDIEAACEAARAAGMLGIGIVTPLVDLSDAHLEMLFRVPVDMVQVRLDADSAAAYARLHGRPVFDGVVGNVERLLAERRARSQPRPLVVCSLVRAAATLAEMEAFYDRWIPAGGWAVIEGHSSYGGALPTDELTPVTPPVREACRRLQRRLLVLSDGRVPYCDQDFSGRSAAGAVTNQSLGQIWNGAALTDLRQAHAALQLGEYPMCAGCAEWFRP